MRNQPAATDQWALLDEVRSMLAPINPVAPSAFEGQEQDWVRPAQPARSAGRWRVLAPALSGVSVIAIVLGVTLVGGAQRPNSAGGSGALPKFYVTVNGLPPKETAIVHSTATGQALSSVHLSEPNGGTVSMIAAARSDREFYIAASVRQPKTGQFAMGILRLSLSADGRSAKLTRLPVYVVDPSVPHPWPPQVLDMAVSPDGRELAAMIFTGTAPASVIKPATELMVIPTHSGGHPAFWRAPKRDFAYGVNVNWVSNRSVAFLWEDQFRGNPADYTARTAVRVLNLRASNHNLLKSAVLMRGGGAFGDIQNAYVGPGGGPIIAALAHDTPAIGPKGTAVARLVAASPVTGKITKVFARRVLHYRNDTRRYIDDGIYSVLGLDASGKDALVQAPRFGMIRNGMFTALPTGRGTMYAAAW
ncbi:MAG TPA: hypothetical protein VGM14_22110 [Streptosporangiaceae bacterium]